MTQFGYPSENGPRQSQPCIALMRAFMRAREFEPGAVQTITAPEWRLLYYLSELYFDRTIVLGYDPREQTADACSPGGWLTDVPEEWTGASNTEELCRALWSGITRLTREQAQTAVVIVAFFRTIPLEKNEVLTTAWHDPAWTSITLTWSHEPWAPFVLHELPAPSPALSI